jgi:hypothetical protein
MPPLQCSLIILSSKATDFSFGSARCISVLASIYPGSIFPGEPRF